MDYQRIIDRYYPEDNQLRYILLTHSRLVCLRALKSCDAHPEWGMDRRFIEEAAMLHDIGIFLTNAPGIHCHGKHPYIMHGILGGELMRQEGLPNIARVCERHTGTGITQEDIISRHLPLPPGNYEPQTIEEQIVCYADKFFAKSHPPGVRTGEETAKSLEKYGSQGVKRFMEWAERFE